MIIFMIFRLTKNETAKFIIITNKNKMKNTAEIHELEFEKLFELIQLHQS